MTIVGFECVTVSRHEARPVIDLRNYRWLFPGRLCPFVGHLEKEQVGKLLDVVTVRQSIITQDVAVVPQFLNDLLGVIIGSQLCSP